MITKMQVPASMEGADMQLLEDLLAPGKEYQSLYGYTFTADDPKWKLTKSVVLHVAPVLDKLDQSIAIGFLATLIHVARTASAHHAYNYLSRYNHMVDVVGGGLTTTALINYRSTLDRTTEHYLGTLRSFIYKWDELGYPGVDKTVVDLLHGWTLRGNIKGDAVQRRDPRVGDLTENELIAFNEGASRSFERGRLTVTELAMALLLSCSGRRPLQISHMKVMDVELSAHKVNGELLNLIQIPRAKQKGSSFRGAFKTFQASSELWAILKAQRKKSICDSELALGNVLEIHEQRLLPLFPDVDAIREHAAVAEFRSQLATDRFHCNPREINDVIKKVVETSGCYSERTGNLLSITPRRFRYTKGTRAARQGIGIAGIAELLDHTDTQNAHVYVKNIPEHVAAIDAAIGHQLASYARAFQGVVVDSERDAKRGEDPTSRIRFRGYAAATCGKHGSCGASVPIPCYTCMFFQPWMDGPHEAVYEELVAERARILEETGDETMAAINDRTIFAVAEVIQRCSRRREELSSAEAV